MDTRRMALAGTAAAVLAAMLTGCGGVPTRLRHGEVMDTLNQQPDHGAYFEAIGIGASDPSLPTQTQRRALSRDAAVAKAQYEMLSMLKGVELQGGVTVKQAMESDSKLTASVDDAIRGAEIVKSEFTEDNGCVVTMRLPKSRAAQTMGVKFK